MVKEEYFEGIRPEYMLFFPPFVGENTRGISRPEDHTRIYRSGLIRWGQAEDRLGNKLSRRRAREWRRGEGQREIGS